MKNKPVKKGGSCSLNESSNVFNDPSFSKITFRKKGNDSQSDVNHPEILDDFFEEGVDLEGQESESECVADCSINNMQVPEHKKKKKKKQSSDGDFIIAYNGLDGVCKDQEKFSESLHQSNYNDHLSVNSLKDLKVKKNKIQSPKEPKHKRKYVQLEESDAPNDTIDSPLLCKKKKNKCQLLDESLFNVSTNILHSKDCDVDRNGSETGNEEDSQSQSPKKKKKKHIELSEVPTKILLSKDCDIDRNGSETGNGEDLQSQSPKKKKKKHIELSEVSTNILHSKDGDIDQIGPGTGNYKDLQSQSPKKKKKKPIELSEVSTNILHSKDCDIDKIGSETGNDEDSQSQSPKKKKKKHIELSDVSSNILHSKDCDIDKIASGTGNDEYLQSQSPKKKKKKHIELSEVSTNILHSKDGDIDKIGPGTGNDEDLQSQSPKKKKKKHIELTDVPTNILHSKDCDIDNIGPGTGGNDEDLQSQSPKKKKKKHTQVSEVSNNILHNKDCDIDKKESKSNNDEDLQSQSTKNKKKKHIQVIEVSTNILHSKYCDIDKSGSGTGNNDNLQSQSQKKKKNKYIKESGISNNILYNKDCDIVKKESKSDNDEDLQSQSTKKKKKKHIQVNEVFSYTKYEQPDSNNDEVGLNNPNTKLNKTPSQQLGDNKTDNSEIKPAEDLPVPPETGVQNKELESKGSFKKHKKNKQFSKNQLTKATSESSNENTSYIYNSSSIFKHQGENPIKESLSNQDDSNISHCTLNKDLGKLNKIVNKQKRKDKHKKDVLEIKDDILSTSSTTLISVDTKEALTTTKCTKEKRLNNNSKSGKKLEDSSNLNTSQKMEKNEIENLRMQLLKQAFGDKKKMKTLPTESTKLKIKGQNHFQDNLESKIVKHEIKSNVCEVENRNEHKKRKRKQKKINDMDKVTNMLISKALKKVCNPKNSSLTKTNSKEVSISKSPILKTNETETKEIGKLNKDVLHSSGSKLNIKKIHESLLSEALKDINTGSKFSKKKKNETKSVKDNI